MWYNLPIVSDPDSLLKCFNYYGLNVPVLKHALSFSHSGKVDFNRSQT